MSKRVMLTADGADNVTIKAGVFTPGTGSGSVWSIQTYSDGLHVAAMTQEGNDGSHTRYFNITAQKSGIYNFNLLHRGKVDTRYSVGFAAHDCFDPNKAMGG